MESSFFSGRSDNSGNYSRDQNLGDLISKLLFNLCWTGLGVGLKGWGGENKEGVEISGIIREGVWDDNNWALV
jgi:hypothetical protein